MKQITLQASMGERVLKRLSEFGELPQRGVVAGQAVASAIQDLYGIGAGVYNDVDIFRLVGASVRKNSAMASSTTEMTKAVYSPTFTDRSEYGCLDAFLESMRSYRVSSVSRDGMLNHVNCALPIREGRRLTASRVIESFDLNCVRVAVDLDTRQLVWDRHFERFLHSRQLEIVAVHTPWHTFLRLLKKLAELPGVYADIPACAEVAAAVAQSRHYQSFLAHGSVTRTFGEKARELAEAHRSIWTPYFELEAEIHQAAGKAVTLYSMTPRGTVDAGLMNKVDQLEGAGLHYCAQAVYQGRRKKSAATQVKFDSVVNEAAGTCVGYGKTLVKAYIRTQQERYVEGQVTPVHVESVSAFLGQHPGLGNQFVDMTLDEQFKCIKRLKQFEREFGQWAYGALEHRALATDMPHDVALRHILETFREEQEKLIQVTPLTLPALPRAWREAGVLVEELLRPLDLEAEGEAMGHCVGGYSGKVRDNQCRILRIRTTGNRADWSTVELSTKNFSPVTPGCQLHAVQHHGRFNEKPSARNQQVLHYILLHLHASKKQLLLEKLGLFDKSLRIQFWLVKQVAGAAEWTVRKLRPPLQRLEEQVVLLDYAKPLPVTVEVDEDRLRSEELDDEGYIPF